MQFEGITNEELMELYDKTIEFCRGQDCCIITVGIYTLSDIRLEILGRMSG